MKRENAWKKRQIVLVYRYQVGYVLVALKAAMLEEGTPEKNRAILSQNHNPRALYSITLKSRCMFGCRVGRSGREFLNLLIIIFVLVLAHVRIRITTHPLFDK